MRAGLTGIEQCTPDRGCCQIAQLPEDARRHSERRSGSRRSVGTGSQDFDGCVMGRCDRDIEVHVVHLLGSDEEVASGVAEVLTSDSPGLPLFDDLERGGQTHPRDRVASQLTPSGRQDRLVDRHLVEDDPVSAVEHGPDSSSHPGEQPLAGWAIPDPRSRTAVLVSRVFVPHARPGSALVPCPMVGNMLRKWSMPTTRCGSGMSTCSCLATAVLPTLEGRPSRSSHPSSGQCRPSVFSILSGGVPEDRVPSQHACGIVEPSACEPLPRPVGATAHGDAEMQLPHSRHRSSAAGPTNDGRSVDSPAQGEECRSRPVTISELTPAD